MGTAPSCLASIPLDTREPLGDSWPWTSRGVMGGCGRGLGKVELVEPAGDCLVSRGHAEAPGLPRNRQVIVRLAPSPTAERDLGC